MKAFEQLVCPTQAEQEAFREECAECFSHPLGQRLLARLCAASHPLEHTPGMTDHEHGRREVIATIWRFTSNGASLAKAQAPQTNEN